MAQRLLKARYVYHWNPLAGSLVGQLHGLGVKAESATIATVTGLAMQPPFSPPALRGEMSRSDRGGGERQRRAGGFATDAPLSPEPAPAQAGGISPRTAGGEGNQHVTFAPEPHSIIIPASLGAGLGALGLRASVIWRQSHQDSRIEPLRRWLIRQRIRRELAHDRAVTAFRAGLDPAGPTWGLIIGFDDGRTSWYRDGPLTEQVGPWLAEADFNVAPELCAIFARVRRSPDRDALIAAAAQAQADAVPQVAEALEGWIAVLESDAEIDPQGHAQAAQTLAAGWGEAAEFWRGHPDSGAAGTVAQAAALTLSRFATLFPYPMGGVPNHPGLRRSAAAILRETIDVLG